MKVINLTDLVRRTTTDQNVGSREPDSSKSESRSREWEVGEHQNCGENQFNPPYLSLCRRGTKHYDACIALKRLAAFAAAFEFGEAASARHHAMNACARARFRTLSQ